jgi:hypothetical protein
MKTRLKAGSALEGADPVARLAFDLKTTLAASHWTHQRQMLEILEWVCGTERQYDHAVVKARALINQEETAMRAIVNRLVLVKEEPNGTQP